MAGPDADPFALLDARCELGASEAAVVGAGAAAVGGGWVGWFGYGLGATIERLPPGPPAPVRQPRFSLAFYDHVVVFDGARWWFEALWSAERDGALRARRALWERRLSTPPPAVEAVSLTPFALAGNGAAGHLAAVADCRRRIAAGELFQANLCVRLEAEVNGDVLDLFARALPQARPRFGALVDGAVSLSPERFLRRSGRRVQTEPIKGTTPRVGSEPERQRALQSLVASRKDAAEHVMIVDLMRNDLGRVCVYATIAVDPPRVEAHAGVWHLVSTVSGRLREDVGDGTLLRATFPPGSVTGAPKVQAMKVIAALEATGRELYTGAIGIISPLAGLDLSVAIRTFETRGRRIWFGAGGGIVADSDPALELAEALAKASGPIAAIGGQMTTPSRRSGRSAHDVGPRQRPRPAPGSGRRSVRDGAGRPRSRSLPARAPRSARGLAADAVRRVHRSQRAGAGAGGSRRGRPGPVTPASPGRSRRRRDRDRVTCRPITRRARPPCPVCAPGRIGRAQMARPTAARRARRPPSGDRPPPG